MPTGKMHAEARHWRRERRWLPKLAPVLPLGVPVPLADGMPAERYPIEWSVYRWLKGERRPPVWGGLGVGDPAWDVMVAWKVLSADTSDILRTGLSVDESTWRGARAVR
jgi:aminoglycoside phosphotransferase (APT) family kinase protein